LTGLEKRILFEVEVIKTKTCSPEKIMKTKKIQIVFAGFSSSTTVRIKGQAEKERSFKTPNSKLQAPEKLQGSNAEF
jgi:hypothetical protein